MSITECEYVLRSPKPAISKYTAFSIKSHCYHCMLLSYIHKIRQFDEIYESTTVVFTM